MKGLTYTLEAHEGGYALKLRGGIIEGTDGALAVLPLKVTGDCMIDFSHVTNANSRGIADWLRFIKEFTKNRKVAFEGCTPVVVATINLMPGFLSKAKVKSVFATFNCPQCKANSQVLLKIDEDLSTSGRLMTVKNCPSCGSQTKLENPDDGYFDFLTFPPG